MPPIQTSYANDYAPGFPGMIANQEVSNVISRTVVDATLAFGIPVYKGSTDHTVTATPGTPFVGITVADKSVRPITIGSVNAYAQGDTAAVLTMGIIWSVTSHAVVEREPVFVTAGGQFTDVASGDTAVPGATFDNTAGANALVKIRLK